MTSPEPGEPPVQVKPHAAGGKKKVVKRKKKVAKTPESNPKPISISDPKPTDFLCYQLGKELGRGAFGCVYQGWDMEKGIYVAIKTISLLRFPDALDSVQQEIALMAPLEDEHIVKYITSHKTNDFLYIVMEYAEGGSIQHVIKSFENFEEHLCAKYIYQVLLGLKYLHEQSIIHRDIKAANILISNNVAKLSDFGISVKLSDSKNSDADFACSPYWAAPEVISMESITEKCDIWSLGITAIEMFTGKPPYFDLNPMRAMFQIVQNPEPPLPPNISPEFKDFLIECFNKNVAFRKGTSQLLQHPWIQQHLHGPIQKTKVDDRFSKFMDDDQAIVFQSVAPAVSNKQTGPSNFTFSDDDDSFADLKPMNKRPITQPSIARIGNGKLSAFQDNDDDFDDMFADEDSNINNKPSKQSGKKKDGIAPMTSLTNLDEFMNDSESFQDLKPTQKKNNAAPKGLEAFADDDDDMGADDLFNTPIKKPIKKQSSPSSLDDFQEDSDDFQDDSPLIKTPLAPAGGLQIHLAAPAKPNANVFEKLSSVFSYEDDNALRKENELMDVVMKHLEMLGESGEGEGENENEVHIPTEEEVDSACQSLLDILKTNAKLKANLGIRHVFIPILTVVQTQRPYTIERFLPVIKETVRDQPKFLKSLCILGLIPQLLKFALDFDTREKRRIGFGAASQIGALDILLHISHLGADGAHPKKKPLQMFISAGGIPGLTAIIKHNPEDQEIIARVIDIITDIFSAQLNTPKTALCRIFAQSGIISLLGERFKLLDKDSPLIKKTLRIFKRFAYADSAVHKRMCDPEFVENLFTHADYEFRAKTGAESTNLYEKDIIKMLKVFNKVAMDKSAAQLLWDTRLPDHLMSYLKMNRSDIKITKVVGCCFTTLFHMSRVMTKKDAPVIAPLIPILIYLLQHDKILKELATTVFLEFIKFHSNEEQMRIRLMKSKALSVLYGMFASYAHKDQILASFEAWAVHQPLQVEAELLAHGDDFSGVLTRMLAVESIAAQYDTATKLLKLCDLCPRLAVDLSGRGVVGHIVNVLLGNSLAVESGTLLEFLNLLAKFSEVTRSPKAFFSMYRADKIAKKYRDSESDLVKDRAMRILRCLASNYIL